MLASDISETYLYYGKTATGERVVLGAALRAHSSDCMITTGLGFEEYPEPAAVQISTRLIEYLRRVSFGHIERLFLILERDILPP